jgi:hypothetical protein
MFAGQGDPRVSSAIKPGVAMIGGILVLADGKDRS